MKLEVGKYYRNADGEKVGPMDGPDLDGDFTAPKEAGYPIKVWHSDGKRYRDRGGDLISEWTEVNNGPDLLKNLNPQDGDIFKCVTRGARFGPYAGEENEFMNGKLKGLPLSYYSLSTFTVVSRATQTPKPFGELSPEEKGALLLAHHEGKRIEWNNGKNKTWRHCPNAVGKFDEYIYRVAPIIAPTRVTGTCEVDPDGEPIKDTFEVSE